MANAAALSTLLQLLLLAIAPLASATEEHDDGYDEYLAGSGSMVPLPPTPAQFRPIDWAIASGTTAIVAVAVCAGVIALKPWNDASCVACVDGCAFKTLFCQNILDAILCVVFVGA